MQLSYYTDYSFRILMFAASLSPGKMGQIKPVAKQLGLAENHVRKIVRELGSGGYLSNKAGKNGGFRLARSPAEINLAGVVQFCETNFALMECFHENRNNCSIMRVCQLRPVMGEALDAFLKVLEKYFLEDILNKQVRESFQRTEV